MERHEEALRAEVRHRAPNWDKAGKGMVLTFPDRRRLMNKKVALADVQAEYPALFAFKQVCAQSVSNYIDTDVICQPKKQCH